MSQRADLARQHAAAFAAAWNRGDAAECDRIALAVTGRPRSSDGLRAHECWDLDVTHITPAEVEPFLAADF